MKYKPEGLLNPREMDEINMIKIKKYKWLDVNGN